MDTDSLAVKRAFGQLGFRIKGIRHKNANGPDCYALKGDRIYTVEIKQARLMKNGTYQTSPVEKNRQADDLIAITFSGHSYVMIEPMKDHLKLCSSRGYRGLSILGYGS